MTDASLYPDPDWADLPAAIAERHGLDADDILCSAGSMDVIAALIMAFCGPGDRVLSTAHGYGYFRTSAQFVQADYDAAPETDLTVDVDALLAMIHCPQPGSSVSPTPATQPARVSSGLS